MDVRDRKRYTIGWIAPLALELIAARAALDENYGALEMDGYSYHIGRIGEHSIVLGLQSKIGTDFAADLAARMQSAFPNIDYFMVVGIAGGVPRYGPPGAFSEIVLGDVVVSYPRDRHGGVYRYDTGAWVEDGQLRPSGHLNSPPDKLLAAVGSLQAIHSDIGSKIPTFVESIRQNIESRQRPRFEDPGPQNDKLYDDDFAHPLGDEDEDCDLLCAAFPRQLRRERSSDANRETDRPNIHYGGIASSNQLLISAVKRKELHRKHNVIAFEMEGAGVIARHACLVIRGICDYADSHKNKRWQSYAAATAAAYTKELLLSLPPSGKAKIYSKTALAEKLRDDRNKIVKWLSTPNRKFTYRNALEQRLKNTGIWFLQSQEYDRWRSDTSSFLWLHGIPGCGKTVLSSTIVEDLLRICDTRPTTTVMHYYYDIRSDESRTIDHLLRSWTIQLMQKWDHVVPRVVLDLFSDCGNGMQMPYTDDLIPVWKACLSKIPECYLVIDALDECSTRSGLLSLLKTVQQWQIPNLHLLVTSRKELDITTALQRFQDVDLVNENMDRDIKLYIDKKLSEGEKMEKWRRSPSDMDLIKERLNEDANGMFRWVACQIVSLERCRSSKQLRQTLQTLPADLHETYERILMEIAEEDTPLALRILQWLVCHDSLLLEELAEIVALDVEREQVYDPSEKLTDPMDVLDICSSLIRITTDSAEEDDSPWVKGRYVQQPKLKCLLAHASVKEYLVAIKLNRASKVPQEPGSLYYLPQDYCHRIVAEASIGYLLQLPSTMYHLDSDYHGAKRDFKLLHCSLNWPFHYELCAVNESLSRSIRRLCSSPDPLNYWLFVHWRYRKGVRNGHSDDLLSYSMRIHADRLASFLLSNGFEVNGEVAHSDDGTTYLHQTIQREDLRSTGLLLEHGADVNVRKRVSEVGIRRYLDTPLHQAVRRGYRMLVKLLLDKGAMIDIEEPCGTPLCAAVTWPVDGGCEIAELLLKHGANVRIRGPEGTALEIALRKPSNIALPLVRTLVDNGPGIADEDLHSVAMSQSGNYDAVKLILEPGAGSDAVALRVAVSKVGNYNDAKQLLEKMTGPDALALQIAVAIVGNCDVVKLLLEKGPDLDASVLLIAVRKKGNYDTVRVLLEHGRYMDTSALQQVLAEATRSDVWIGTYCDGFPDLMKHDFFSKAVIEEGIVTRLLIFATAKYSKVPFSTRSAMVEKLLIDTLRREPTFPLKKISREHHLIYRAASSFPVSDVVEFLWQSGAEIQETDGTEHRLKTDETALEAAVMRGAVATVSFLLEKGFRIETDTRPYRGNFIPTYYLKEEGYQIKDDLRHIFRSYGYDMVFEISSENYVRYKLSRIQQ